MARTIEDAYAEHCNHLPNVAPDARRIVEAGGIHEVRIVTRRTKKRGFVCEMTSREVNEKPEGKRLLDLV